MNRRLIIMLGAILFVLPLLVGCGSGNNPTLAVVGGQDITLEDFKLVYGNLRTQYATAEEEFEGKKQLLDSMVITRLLINSAYEKNIDKLEELARIVLASRNQFLLDALYEDLVIKHAEPSDAEIKEFYNKLEYQIRASHILLKDADTAQSIFERVKAGENFDKLAYDYSIDPSAKKNRGDLGYFLWGAMVEEFQVTAFAMEPGE
ncbi:MAG: peptidylprolyl isomerase, partial [candidate division Zixibacteria bacterium]|nr:peptidylprolyl isomerase [candidate division Zixibacteria bacterium]